MKKLVACLLMVLMLAGTSWAWDEVYHVKQAPNKLGDLIIFPGYLALNGGWETKYTVINTSDTYSMVAKVVVRSYYWTDELLDFLIYLSPRDVWTGYIRNNGTNVYVYSDDDSILVSANTFASPENPVQQPLFINGMCSNDSPQIGYVEVMQTWYGEAANYTGLVAPAAGEDVNTPKVDKSYLLKLYPPDSANQPAGYVALGNDSHLLDHTINFMTGYMEIQNPSITGMTAMMEGRVFADFDLVDYLKVTEVSGLNAYDGMNSLGELEAAMSADFLAMPYLNKSDAVSIHFFNFPTKMAWNTDCKYDATHQPLGPYWQQYGSWNAAGTVFTPDQCVDYEAPYFDLKENELQSSDLFSGGTSITLSMCEELHFIATNYTGLFSEGWVEYVLDLSTMHADSSTWFDPQRSWDNLDNAGLTAREDNDFSYIGIPVIPYIMNIKNGLTLAYGAYEDGSVFADVPPLAAGDSTWLPEYQYWNHMLTWGLHNTVTGYPESTNVNWALDVWTPVAPSVVWPGQAYMVP